MNLGVHGTHKRVIATEIKKGKKVEKVKCYWGDVLLASEEEYLFMCWCRDAALLGLIDETVQYQVAYELADKITHSVKDPGPRSANRTKQRTLLGAHKYTLDMILNAKAITDDKGNYIPKVNTLSSTDLVSKGAFYMDTNKLLLVDVKGGCGRNGKKSSDITFPLNQKWLFDRYSLYCNKVNITKDRKKNFGFFGTYWAPAEAFVTAKGNATIAYRKCKTIKDISI
jgi:hypothetical protein